MTGKLSSHTVNVNFFGLASWQKCHSITWQDIEILPDRPSAHKYYCEKVPSTEIDMTLFWDIGDARERGCTKKGIFNGRFLCQSPSPDAVASGSESCLIDRKPVILLGLMSIVTIRRKVVVQRRRCCCWKKIIGAIQSWMNTSSEGPSDLASAQHFHSRETSICSLLKSESSWYQHPKLFPHPPSLLHTYYCNTATFFYNQLFSTLWPTSKKSNQVSFVRHNQEIDGATDKSHYLLFHLPWFVMQSGKLD